MQIVFFRVNPALPFALVYYIIGAPVFQDKMLNFILQKPVVLL